MSTKRNWNGAICVILKTMKAQAFAVIGIALIVGFSWQPQRQHKANTVGVDPGNVRTTTEIVESAAKRGHRLALFAAG